MRDLDDLRDLKREYMELVRRHGAEMTELRSFKQSLLALNRRHRREAAAMYGAIIAKVEKKLRIGLLPRVR